MQVSMSQSTISDLRAGISEETINTYSFFLLSSNDLLTPATIFASILPWFDRKCMGFVQVTPLLADRPIRITLSTNFDSLTASNTHWIMGLPATSINALELPLE